MIMFKEDVTNCFNNQIAFSTSSSKLLCAIIMIDYETVFVMITCGFGHTVTTPMAVSYTHLTLPTKRIV